MKYQELLTEFTQKFNNKNDHLLRGIGIEAEIPVVTEQGEAVSLTIIQDMFFYLESKGFQLKRDDSFGYIMSATSINKESVKKFDYHFDTITTDTGYSTLEIALAPQQNLHDVQSSFSAIMTLLVAYFDRQNCKMLGYGIQPLTAPSRKLLMPKERHFFYEKFSPNNIIPKLEGADAHLLTISASNQCHIDISERDANIATNVLNALSGLQIAFHANSPVWKGTIDATYKATREFFWESCYPDRLDQMGIPPRFETMEDYIQYLLQLKPMLIERNKELLQILNKQTFKDFMFGETPVIGQTLEGEKVMTDPESKDIHYLNTFCYFNARLVPQYGTIESRMCCQQPPNETLAPSAVTLGLLENLEAAQQLMEMFPLNTWKKIRRAAAQHTFKTVINGISILPILSKFLDISAQGLRKRNLGEEVFLEPLYERLKQQKSPADIGIAIFEKEGIKGLLSHYSFKKEDCLEPTHDLLQNELQTI